jgi:hypothetical protein
MLVGARSRWYLVLLLALRAGPAGLGNYSKE